MRHGFLVVLVGLAVSLIAGCVNSGTSTDVRLDKAIQILLDAIRARDDSAILSLATNPQSFGEGGRFIESVAGFLYDGDYLRENHPDVRSVVEIMALGPLRVHIVREIVDPTAVVSSPENLGEKARVVMVETDGRATVLFVPEQFEEQLQVDSFYGERWMRDDFACEFHLIDGRWVLLYNICFALTDGPYPEPYGLRLAPIQSRLAQAVREPSAQEGKPPIEVYSKLLPFVTDKVVNARAPRAGLARAPKAWRVADCWRPAPVLA